MAELLTLALELGFDHAAPLDTGKLRALIQETDGILVHTTARLRDDFDMETMNLAQETHKKRFFDLARQARILYPDVLPLTAGSCTVCRACTYPDRPCRFPQKMLSSMEAYGLLVSEVCKDAGLAYYYGPRTLTYSACILTKEG